MSCFSSWITPATKQTWIVLPVLLLKISAGMVLGFTTSILAALQSPHSDIQMDLDTASWFASAMPLACILGLITSTCMMPKLGRRNSFLAHSVPGIVGSLVTYFAGDVTALMIGRVLIGVSMGGNVLTGIIIVGECTSPRNRAMFLNISTASHNIGNLIVHTLGYYVSWRTLVLIIGIPFILCLLISYTWPESPSWLAEKQKFEKSREAFYWLRGRTEDNTREIEELIRAQSHKKIDKTISIHIVDFFQTFKKRKFLKPLLVTLVSVILLESGGRHIFPAYAIQLIREVMSGGFSQSLYNIVVDVLIMVSGFTASYLVRVVRVRTLLFTSGTMAFLVLCFTCVAMYLDRAGMFPGQWSLVPVVLFSIFFILSNLGCTCIPIALKGEIFPLEHRTFASMISFIMMMITSMVSLKMIPVLISNIYIYGAFSVVALCMGVSLLLLYFILPETKDRTLLEIEHYFTHGQYTDGEPVPTHEQCNKTKVLNNIC